MTTLRAYPNLSKVAHKLHINIKNKNWSVVTKQCSAKTQLLPKLIYILSFLLYLKHLTVIVGSEKRLKREVNI